MLESWFFINFVINDFILQMWLLKNEPKTHMHTYMRTLSDQFYFVYFDVLNVCYHLSMKSRSKRLVSNYWLNLQFI